MKVDPEVREPESAAPRARFARLLGMHVVEREWRASGQQVAGVWLGRLPEGWFVFHDVPAGERGATIEQVVFGPGGVFTITTKSLAGSIRVNPRSIVHDGHRTSLLAKASAEARRAGSLLSCRGRPGRRGPWTPRDPGGRVDRAAAAHRRLRRWSEEREALDAPAAPGPPLQRRDRAGGRGLAARHVDGPAGGSAGERLDAAVPREHPDPNRPVGDVACPQRCPPSGGHGTVSGPFRSASDPCSDSAGSLDLADTCRRCQVGHPSGRWNDHVPPPWRPVRARLPARDGSSPTARHRHGGGRLDRAAAAPPRDRRLARTLDGDGCRSRSAEALPPDARRRDRGAGRSTDPHRRAVALRLRLVQLPRFRSRSRDHRGGPGVPGPVGDPSVVVAPPREPGPVRGDRGEGDRARRRGGHPPVPDDHPHPHVGDPGPRRRGRDLPGRPGAQDDLRRRDDRARTRRDGPTLPARRRGASRGAAPREHDHAPRDRARRRELDARQRSGPARVRTAGPRVRRVALRRRCARLRRGRRALAGRALRLGHARQRHRPPSGRDLRERDLRRRLLEGVLVPPVVPHAAHAAEGRAEGGGASVPLLRDRRRWPRSPRRSRAWT